MAGGRGNIGRSRFCETVSLSLLRRRFRASEAVEGAGRLRTCRRDTRWRVRLDIGRCSTRFCRCSEPCQSVPVLARCAARIWNVAAEGAAKSSGNPKKLVQPAKAAHPQVPGPETTSNRANQPHANATRPPRLPQHHPPPPRNAPPATSTLRTAQQPDRRALDVVPRDGSLVPGCAIARA